MERRRKRKKKKLPRPFLLNLPLIVADFVSCGFTVTVRYVLKKKERPFLALSLKWNKRPQKMRVSLHVGFMAAWAGIPSPRWSTGLVLMAPAPVPSTALTSQRICWKTRTRTSVRTYGGIVHSSVVSPSSSYYKMPPHHRFAYLHAAPPATKD